MAYKDKRIGKNKKPLKRDEREMMELQDQVVVETLTEKGVWSDEHISMLVEKQGLSRHETTEFACVESHLYHTVEDIGEENLEILSLLEIELELAGLKRTRGTTKGDKKKRVRGMSKDDRDALMQGNHSWHLKGENWPASKQDTKKAKKYLKKCLKEEDANRSEETAVKLLAHQEECDMQRKDRLERLKRLLSETAGASSSLGPEARKTEIKKLLHKIHGHYFNKLFNMLQPGESAAAGGASDRSGAVGGGGAVASGAAAAAAATVAARPTADEVDAMAAELAAEEDGEEEEEEEDAVVPARGGLASADQSSSSEGGETKNDTPRVQEVHDDPGSPERPVVPRRSGSSGNANLLRQSAVVDYTGEDQRERVSIEEDAAGNENAGSPVEQDHMNYSNWDDEDDDAVGSGEGNVVRRLDSNGDDLDSTVGSVVATSFDASTAADAYEQGNSEIQRSPEKARDNAAEDIRAVQRGGASPGNRRGRSTGGELALDEFGEDSMDLDGSWDM